MDNFIKKAGDTCALAAGYFSGFVLVIMAFAMFYEVVVRRIGYPTLWCAEFVGYFLLWSMFIGAAYTQHQEAHVRVDIFDEFLPKKVKAFFALAGIVLGIIFTLTILWAGLLQMADSYMVHKVSNSPMRVPVYLVDLGIPVGALLILIELLYLLYKKIKGLRKQL